MATQQPLKLKLLMRPTDHEYVYEWQCYDDDDNTGHDCGYHCICIGWC